MSIVWRKCFWTRIVRNSTKQWWSTLPPNTDYGNSIKHWWSTLPKNIDYKKKFHWRPDGRHFNKTWTPLSQHMLLKYTERRHRYLQWYSHSIFLIGVLHVSITITNLIRIFCKSNECEVNTYLHREILDFCLINTAR